ADRNRSHWSTSKTPSYTKSVSWQHHPDRQYIEVKDLTPSSRQFFMTTIRQVVVIKLFGARGSINTHFIFLKVNPNNPVSSQIIYYVMFYGTL
ncbi:hypothetical protein ACQE34_21580, partial [Escherichia coli]